MKRKLPKTIPFNHLAEWKKISNVESNTNVEKVATICKLISFPLKENVLIGIGGSNSPFVEILPKTEDEPARVLVSHEIVEELEADALGGLLLATAKRTETEKIEDKENLFKFKHRIKYRSNLDSKVSDSLVDIINAVSDSLENAKAREEIEKTGWKFQAYFNALAKKYFHNSSDKPNSLEPLLFAIQTGDASFIDKATCNAELKKIMEKALKIAQTPSMSVYEKTKKIVNIIKNFILTPPQQKQNKKNNQKQTNNDNKQNSENDQQKQINDTKKNNQQNNQSDKNDDKKTNENNQKQSNDELENNQYQDVYTPQAKIRICYAKNSLMSQEALNESNFISMKNPSAFKVKYDYKTKFVTAGPDELKIFENDNKANNIAEAVAGKILRAKKYLRHIVHGVDSGELDDLNLQNYPLSDKPNIWMEDRSIRLKKDKIKVALLIDVSGSMENQYKDVASMTAGIAIGLKCQGISAECFAFSRDFYILESPIAIYNAGAFEFHSTALCEAICKTKENLDEKYGINPSARDRFFFVITDGKPDRTTADWNVFTGRTTKKEQSFSNDYYYRVARVACRVSLRNLAGSGWTSFGFGYGDELDENLMQEIFGDNKILMKELDPVLIANTISDIVSEKICQNAQDLCLNTEETIKI